MRKKGARIRGRTRWTWSPITEAGQRKPSRQKDSLDSTRKETNAYPARHKSFRYESETDCFTHRSN